MLIKQHSCVFLIQNEIPPLKRSCLYLYKGAGEVFSPPSINIEVSVEQSLSTYKSDEEHAFSIYGDGGSRTRV